MSKKHNARPNTPDAAKAQRAQVLGFIAGAVIVLLLTGIAVKRSTSSTQTTEATPVAAAAAMPAPEAAAMPAAVPAQPSGNFKRMTVDEVKPLWEKGEVMILDVRDMDAYLAKHIKGAGQIPVSRLEGEIPYLPKDKLLVLYCTCPNEESSGVGAEILQHGGITNVAALTGGLDAWIAKGLPTATGQ